MLDHPLPQPLRQRSRRYPKLGPHTASVPRMVQENFTLPPSARLSIKAMYERLRDEEGFRGGYSTVKDYVRPTAPDSACIWEYIYDMLVSVEKKRAIDFLFLLSSTTATTRRWTTPRWRSTGTLPTEMSTSCSTPEGRERKSGARSVSRLTFPKLKTARTLVTAECSTARDVRGVARRIAALGGMRTENVHDVDGR